MVCQHRSGVSARGDSAAQATGDPGPMGGVARVSVRAATVLAGKHSRTDWASSLVDAEVLLAAALYFDKAEPEVASWLAGESAALFHRWTAPERRSGDGTAMQDRIRSSLYTIERILGGV